MRQRGDVFWQMNGCMGTLYCVKGMGRDFGSRIWGVQAHCIVKELRGREMEEL